MNRIFVVLLVLILPFSCQSTKKADNEVGRSQDMVKRMEHTETKSGNKGKRGYYNVEFHSLEEFANYDPKNYPRDVSIKEKVDRDTSAKEDVPDNSPSEVSFSEE